MPSTLIYRAHAGSMTEFARIFPTIQVEQVSGHSVRVGATQDLLALNMDLASVMREGRWTTVRMPMRYGEHVMAARGGMAREAKEQGREQ